MPSTCNFFVIQWPMGRTYQADRGRLPRKRQEVWPGGVREAEERSPTSR